MKLYGAVGGTNERTNDPTPSEGEGELDRARARTFTVAADAADAADTRFTPNYAVAANVYT